MTRRSSSARATPTRGLTAVSYWKISAGFLKRSYRYDKVLALRPSDAEAWNNRGIALRKLGRYSDAVASYDKALAIRPAYTEAWLNRGVALDYLGRYEEAIASYDKVLALQPNHTTALENREIALTKEKGLNPATLGMLALVVILIAAVVLWYMKPQNLIGKKSARRNHEQMIVAEKPEEKLTYGTVPEESKLYTLATLCRVMNEYGLPILNDREKLSALLDEFSGGEYKNERKILVLALHDNIPQELLEAAQGVSLDQHLSPAAETADGKPRHTRGPRPLGYRDMGKSAGYGEVVPVRIV